MSPLAPLLTERIDWQEATRLTNAYEKKYPNNDRCYSFFSKRKMAFVSNDFKIGIKAHLCYHSGLNAIFHALETGRVSLSASHNVPNEPEEEFLVVPDLLFSPYTNFEVAGVKTIGGLTMLHKDNVSNYKSAFANIFNGETPNTVTFTNIDQVAIESISKIKESNGLVLITGYDQDYEDLKPMRNPIRVIAAGFNHAYQVLKDDYIAEHTYP